ncbi:putative receptor-like serine/threonine-protein kinase [Capsicum chinense]|uniref:non-specific serine/threonine protein kinase n=1 Tax=Capsicum annuum TaxID=4072 RepID=A0A1U8F7F9_CAPAN|nr:probable receptor-like serine/threonine-protein kinase At4g34500 [Capsicum annuum]XP_047251108.1 probable receptor-like serine/threonine-protein kinase At4g34500 [Capsicum annuum]PHU10602.1 putative receptor-like serine/threonine-protein kinase [Capsicum chinense]KAF3660667.1 putative receptor-like serine/threonine-protein kinase [Capsicum annuum]KAF3679046.1 putative receptor-like serine/threonine-protein kinase [Capsicum annuum]PHT62106.1 putative receptor-like serine/threonine-protein ki
MSVSGETQSSGNSSITSFFTAKTPILGLQLYIVIAATVIIMVVILFLICLLIRLNRTSKRNCIGSKKSSGLLPLVADVIRENRTTDLNEIGGKIDRKKEDETIAILRKEAQEVLEIESEGIKGSSGSNESSTSRSDTSSAISGSNESTNIGWGRWYSLKELEMATNGFRAENVIGEGGYGVVFRGELQDGSVVAVKKLLNNKGQAEKEFRVEVEAIGKVRHKNLAGLLGYCSEGAHRILVYEYIDNGNLEQWLHGDVGSVSPLTWEIRMKIAIGTARGLAYLHEGLEPKVVHRDVKSSNILLDRKWNPKVSDFGLAKLLVSEKSYVTTRVMGTFGYVSPDYASTGMLNEGSDVYSFGVMLMEIITGRSPVDYSRPPGEMNLVDWFKGMVANRRGEELVDPLIEVHPPPRSLKRVLLICLRCIDMDANKRPKMGQIVHMLEADEFPFRSEPRLVQEGPLNPRLAGINRLQLATKNGAGDDDQKPRGR